MERTAQPWTTDCIVPGTRNAAGGIAVVQISLAEDDAQILRETLEAKLIELRREESHTDSPRFRETLYRVEAAVSRLLTQLPQTTPGR